MKNISKMLNLLNQLGYNIVEINDEIFIFNVFEGYSSHVFFSTLKGRDITELIQDPQSLQLSGTPKQQQDFITTKIEELPIIRKQYSNNFSYILHLS